MNDQLARLLQQTNFFSQEDLALAEHLFVPKVYRKNEYLIQEGGVCEWVAFVGRGIIRNHYISSKGEEVTYCITFPGMFITAYSSFISGSATFENIQAITEAEVYLMKRSDFHRLRNSSSNWMKFSNHFAEQSYLMMEQRLLGFQMEPATKRYEDLLTNHPEYILQVPLKYIASYLGVTQRHLSRLRKAL